MDREDRERLRASAFQNLRNMDREDRERPVTYLSVTVSLLEDAEHAAEGWERNEAGPHSELTRELQQLREQTGADQVRLKSMSEVTDYFLTNS